METLFGPKLLKSMETLNPKPWKPRNLKVGIHGIQNCRSVENQKVALVYSIQSGIMKSLIS